MHANRRWLLLGGYAVVLLAPLALTVGVVKPGAQGRIVVFADALGFAGLSLIALQIIVSGRSATITRHFGLRKVLALHRQAGIAVLVLVLAHVVFLLVDDPARIALLDPLTAPGRARAGVLALLGLVALGCTSAWRARLGLRYERWRQLHLGLTVLVLTAAFVHVIWVDAYSSAPTVRVSVLALVLAAAAALFWARVARPYATAVRPYRILGMRRERGDAVTVELAADGHDGLRFRPGQFARLRLGSSPYGLDDHPFTISSSARHPDRPSLTVKALGDFSVAIAGLAVGTAVLLDGPHGEAVLDGGAVQGRLLVAAGIGITPAMSVLRTAAEHADERPHLLLYGSRCWADVTFREELDDLGRRLPWLRVVHVLSRPEPGWVGDRGRIDHGVMRRHVPREVERWSALVCGPPALVAASYASLIGLGMSPAAIQAEGFE